MVDIFEADEAEAELGRIPFSLAIQEFNQATNVPDRGGNLDLSQSAASDFFAEKSATTCHRQPY